MRWVIGCVVGVMLMGVAGCATAPTHDGKLPLQWSAPPECEVGYMIIMEDKDRKVVAPLIVCNKNQI